MPVESDCVIRGSDFSFAASQILLRGPLYRKLVLEVRDALVKRTDF